MYPSSAIDPLLAKLDVRVGTDIQAIEEIERSVRLHGSRYLSRLFTRHEVDSCGGPTAPAEILAPGLTARFAAKEATLKVLRPTDRVPGWRDIEIERQPGGWCELRLANVAQELAAWDNFLRFSVSISHGFGNAVATVIGMRLLSEVSGDL